MGCSLTKGRTLSCTQAIGGIKRVYFSLWSKTFWSSDLTYNGTDVYQIDDIDSSTNMVQYDTRPNLSQMTVTVANGDASAGTPAFYDQACDLVLQKLDVVSLAYLKELGDSRTIAWVLDMNNRIWVLGLKHGCRITGGTFVSGTARGDMSGFTLSLSAQEAEPMYGVKFDASATETTANYPWTGITTPANAAIQAQVTPA
tara:strand:- start:12900 stop:13499 length:600 start_codon:yes stop_codon:yes gene_type:complete